MQTFTPLLSYAVLIVNLSITNKISHIVKNTVTCLFINRLDKTYLDIFEQPIKANLQNVNKMGIFKISSDSNSTSRLLNRATRDFRKMRLIHWIDLVFNLCVNLGFMILVNFNVLIFNYYLPAGVTAY